MRIQNNMMAANTYRQYNIANNQTAGYAEKLSSGYQINRAGDDAAGLAISEKMRAQIRGLNMASKNSLDAVSLIQTAEGALQSTHDILQRMRELAVQSASDTNEQVIDRGALNQEFQALKAEIDDTARVTRFNDQNLIDGTFQKAFYSTDITNSNLTDQTIADVSRVGVKSNHNQTGVYKINVEYIEAKETQYAKASYVDTQVANENKRIQLASDGGNSIITAVDFEAVKTAKFNGKTFEVRASGSGKDLEDDTNGLKISLYDKSTGTTYVGDIKPTKDMNGGSVLTVTFDGLGEMKLDIKTDITDPEQYVSNIAEALNTKEIKFVQSSEVLSSSGLGRNDAFAKEVYSYKPVAASGIKETTAGTFTSMIDLKDGTVALNITVAATVGTIAATVSFALADGTTVDFKVAGTVSTNHVTAIGSGGAAGKTTFTMTGPGDYGVYTLEVDFAKTTTEADFKKAVEDALKGFKISTKDDSYSITTRFDSAGEDAAAANTTLEVLVPTVAVDSMGVADISDLEIKITNDITGATATYAAPSMSMTKLSGDGPADELVYALEIDGYGTFTINIGASDGRTADDLGTELTNALKGITQKLGDKSEGQDNVKGSDAQIALSLNGEMVVLEQNDSRATFNSSGVALEFRALDFSKIEDTATATAQFTKNGGNTIDIHVTESQGKSLVIQTGANQGDELDINIDAMNTQLLGIRNADISTQKTSSEAITLVNNAINQVSTQRAALGALQNRLNFKIANLDTSAENLQAAESRIRDTDMAKTMTAFTKSNILSQAATAMLAQANSQPQNVLQLLR